jgi:hypothetical protein
MRHGSQAVHNRPDPHSADDSGRVLRFPSGRPSVPPLPGRVRPDHPKADTVDDFARYEEKQYEPIDYRHRMMMNVIAVVIVSLLVGAGVWIADTIADMQRDQDCVLQGRANCAPIEAPAPNRK